MGAFEVLAATIGADRVRLADHSDAFGSATPEAVVEPRSAAEVAQVLERASTDGIALVVRGGGTKIGWGPPPTRCDAILSTASLTRLVEHEPGDMTCVVEAGKLVADLQREIGAVATHRQRLMLDSPGGDAATIGGTIATGAAGARRVRYGTPRDLVIGARYVTGDGLVAHTGGKVVKNVAGYDVAKLLIGSFGTLAVVTELALKLHPIPDVTRTLVLYTNDASEVAQFCNAVRTAPVTPAMVEVAWPEGLVLVRIESTANGADAQVERLRGLGAIDVLNAADGDALAARVATLAWEGDAPVIAVASMPSRLADLLRVIAAGGGVLSARATITSGEVRLLDADPARAQSLISALRELGANIAVRRGDLNLHALALPTFDPGLRFVSEALKQNLDPSSILAPGRALGAAR